MGGVSFEIYEKRVLDLKAEIASLRQSVERLRNPPDEILEIGADECHCPLEVMRSAWSLVARKALANEQSSGEDKR